MAGGLSEEASPVIEIRRRRPGTNDPPDHFSSDVQLTGEAGRAGGKSAHAAATQHRLVPVEELLHRSKTPEAVEPPSEALLRTMGVMRYDLSKEENRDAMARGIAIQDGDIVMIGQHKPSFVYIVGSVRTPGPYRMPVDRELRVLEAVSTAGGVNTNTSPTKALVIRHHPDDAGVTVVKVDLNKAKKDLEENILLKPGDTVSVEETVASYTRGLLRNAFRIGVGVGAEYNALGPPGSQAY
jgi:DNA-directed RNA polymerase subunit H (RpoH/RPB5)